MAEDPREIQRALLLENFDPNNPAVRAALLAARVDTLCKEKESIEADVTDLRTRMAQLEATYNRGWGVFWALSGIGAVVGFAIGLWKFASGR